MRFTPQFLDELRARLPVSEVVGRRVKLRKQGREFIGLSPFNKEKSPSFTVNDHKGFFHDFSSGKHGDIFGFVMETEGVGFPEAVERLVVAAADLAWARIHWRRDQRMSRQELKEELRQTEGDRLMKARLRSLRLDRSRKRMLAAVPRATMVVANPTHYAVALRYVRSEGGAPIVLAKGVDLIALKIREIAEENNIPIVEDRPLARALYGAVSIDAAIPAEFYRAVAEIVHLLQGKKSSWPIVRNR